MPFDPQADRFGRTLLVAIALWGGLAGAVYITLVSVLPTHPPAAGLQATIQPTCMPTVPFDPPLATDLIAPIVHASSRCNASLATSNDPNASLRAYLEGAELDGTPHAPPPSVDAALLARGGELYRRHCAACHGIAGEGTGANACAIATQPTKLITGVFALRTTEHEALPTDEDLFRTITRGIHGTAMPPWFLLGERDRWALVAHVKTLSKQFTEDSAPPSLDFGRAPEVTPAHIAKGEALFTSRGCASCHGNTGHGDGVAAASLATRPRDFTSGRFHRGSAVADIHETLVTGLDGTPMASFAKVLPGDELWDISSYVASMSPRLSDRDGLRCPEQIGPWNKEEEFGVRNLIQTLRPGAPVAGSVMAQRLRRRAHAGKRCAFGARIAAISTAPIVQRWRHMSRCSYRSKLILFVALLTLTFGVRRASAIPAFARKYKTSCTTCHTVFPKLNPFGEQFRRNNYRFPGIDSDAVKAEPIPLGTDEQKKMFPDAVWPGTLTSFPPLAFGFNGAAVIHPDKNSSGGAADNHAVFNIDNQVKEAHLWAAGSIDDSITFYSEVTFAPDGVSVENASLYFNDLIGPAHAVNIALGKRGASLTSFAPHSSYITDMALPMIPVTALFGATSDPFLFGNNHNGIEVNGVLGARFGYAAGIAAGTNLDTRNSANIYAHAGYKVGGSTLDGEDTGGVPQDLAHEHSVTFDVFGYRSVSRFNDSMMALTKDTSLTGGGDLRFQYETFELDTGAFVQTDDHVVLGSPKVTTVAQWNEASWLPYPWLSIATRVEYLRVDDGTRAVNDLRITPGVAALVRPNIRFSLTVPVERASGAPDAGWGGADLAAAPSAPGATVGPEVESILLGLFTAF